MTVKRSSYYTQGGIEAIDYVRAKLTTEEFVGSCKANVSKYISRAGKKGNALEDLKKAQMYLRWAVEKLEGK